MTIPAARADAARADLAELRELYVRAWLALPHRGGRRDGRAARRHAAPLPFSLAMWTLTEDITRTVVSWHARGLTQAGARRCPDPRRAGRGDLDRAFRWLAASWATVMTGPDAAAVCESLARLTAQARWLLGMVPLVHPLPVPCPYCGERLSRADGSATVRCRGCQASWTQEQYRLLVKILAAEVMTG